MDSSTEDLEQLYGDLILEHFREPVNKFVLANPDKTSTVHNPLCGDEVTVFVKFEGDKLSEISFQGKGCSISQAGASMMIQDLLGKTREEALDSLETFSEVLAGKLEQGSERAQGLEESKALYGVSAFAARIKCAMLAWEGLNKVLKA